MRLTLVISSLGGGGAERVLSLMADYWTAKGWHITLITFDAAENDFFSVPAGVTRIALDLMGDSASAVQALRGNFQRVQRLRQAILRSQPQAVVSFIEKVNILTLCACLGLSVPVIVSERVDPRQHSIGRGWSVLRKLLYPSASAVVVQSESVRSWAQGVFRIRLLRTIPNPVLPPAPRSQSNQAIVPPPSQPFIAALGRLAAQKGFDVLLQAAAPVLEKHPEWTLLILGEGPERQNLEQLAVQLGISHRVQLPGHVQEPTQLISQADLFVLSSRFEGFPNALLEAMSCGLPVISTDCPSGPGEIIRDGIDGLLVPPEDKEALTAAMDRLMSDKAERVRLASRASDVLTRFGVDGVMRMWEDLLEEVSRPDSTARA